VAASILQLIEKSVNTSSPLKLTTPISHLIDFVTRDDYVTTHATLEDALSHRTGMPRHDFSYGGRGWTVKDVVYNLRNLPLTAEIRQQWQYCNMMFMTLSHVIETLTGSWLGDYLQKNIWHPLGMNFTFFSIDDALTASAKNPLAVMSTPYFWNNKTQAFVSENYLNDTSTSGAGNVISSVLDYALYLRAMLDKDKRILSVHSYDELRTPRAFMPGPPDPIYGLSFSSYTLAWQSGSWRGMQVYQHSGSVTGYGALMAYIPEKHYGFAIMGNSEISSNMVAEILASELVDRLAGVPTDKRTNWSELLKEGLRQKELHLRNAVRALYPDLPKTPLPPSLPLDQYTGTYADEGYGALELKLVNTSSIDNPRRLIKSDQVLHIQVRNRTWEHIINLEHVNGEHFVAWFHAPNKGRDMFNGASYAEFRVRPNGKVNCFGIVYDSAPMGEEKIWFKKLPE
jgi:CubicO group peptidase (beta-lactamase class C family)